jgi:hypothetical protein
MLPGSALKVHGGVVVGWLPTHYQVKLRLMLRLSWAVTIKLTQMNQTKAIVELGNNDLCLDYSWINHFLH